MEEFKEKAEKLIEKVRSNADYSLHISRVPSETKKEFLALANSEEFVGDYGFTLKFLLDFRKGLLSSPNEELAQRIDVLAQQVVLLQNQFQAENVEIEEEGIRLVNGKTLKR